MLKTKHKIILGVVAVIAALLLLFFVGKEIAAGFAAVLGIFGFSGSKALKKKSEEVEREADQEKEITKKVENNINDRQSKDEQLQQDDKERFKTAKKLEEKSEDGEKEMQQIREDQAARKEKGEKLSARLKELKGDDSN